MSHSGLVYHLLYFKMLPNDSVQSDWISKIYQHTSTVTFLLKSELSLGLNILKGCSQVPGQTPSVADCQQGTLLGQTKYLKI